MLGIVGQLAKDTESVIAIYDGKEIVKRLRGLKTWGFIREVTMETEGTDPEEEMAEGMAEAGKFLGEEIFIATGKGTAPQFGNLVKIGDRMNYFQMRMMVQSFANGVKNGDISGVGETDPEAMMEMAKELGKDIPLVESLVMPPVLVGIKAADAETLGKARQELSSNIDMMFGMMGEGAVPVEFTRSGVAFKGYKLLGSFLAEQMEQGREGMEAMFEPGDVDRLIAAIKEKNLVVAHGSSENNHLMIYTGNSEDECPLAESVDQSLAANDAISFVDAYKDKKIASFIYSDKGLVKETVVGNLKSMAEGVRDGLAGTDAFGDTRELAALLDMVVEKEQAVLALAKPETFGALAVLDEGVKFETFGGSNYGAIDYSAPHQLAKLGEKEDVLLFANWIRDKEHAERTGEYLETVVETAYAMTERIAGMELEDESFLQFKQGFGLFNEKFRADTVALFNAAGTACDALGMETALVVDLKGAMPKFPGVPQEVADGGKFVRATMLAPVTDRAKLGESWKQLDASLKNILKTASEMSGDEIPMQDPLSSKENGFTTWFFAVPFTNDDFIPSVTVSDKWFALSSSKLQALDLASAADAAAGDRKGAWMEFDFDTLRKAGGEWVDLLEKNGESVFGGPEAFADFQENLPRIRKGLAAIEEFDALSIHERLEGGKLRGTMHFKMR